MAIANLGLGSVAWIFGGMGAGVIVVRSYQTIFNQTLKPNKIGRKIGQGMVGLSIGFAIADSDLLAASSRLPLFIFLTLFMLLCGSAIGYFYARVSKTNLLVEGLPDKWVIQVFDETKDCNPCFTFISPIKASESETGLEEMPKSIAEILRSERQNLVISH